MPTRILRPRPLAWLLYAFLAAAGLQFLLTDESISLQAVVGTWATPVTALMLVIGSAAATVGSFVHSYGLELSGYPMLIGVWVTYGGAIAVQSVSTPTPLGFAFLLGAGAAGLTGRGWELWNAVQVSRDLRRRQAARAA